MVDMLTEQESTLQSILNITITHYFRTLLTVVTKRWEVPISLRIYRSNYNIYFPTLPISSAFRPTYTPSNEISIRNYNADNPRHIRKKRIISTIVRYSNLRFLPGEGIRRTRLPKLLTYM